MGESVTDRSGNGLAGRHALITGASSGIGAALAVELARQGVTVELVARRADRLAETLDACRAHAPGSAMHVCDLADSGAVDRLVDEIGGTPVDILVNNAGMPKRREIRRLDPATVEQVMATNYFGAVRLTLGLLPTLLSRARAHVVTVSSIAAKLSAPGEAAYDASKAALSAFFEAMAVELFDSPVSVHLVYPGLVDTELFALPDNDPLQDSGVDPLPPTAVVDAIVAQLVSGGIEAWVPPMFHDVYAFKAGDLSGYVDGAAAWRREQAAEGDGAGA
ncbi:MAG: SDR family NAD(P)-dependent oxidoreductase [Acidimicrobiales bacterium]